MRQACLLPVSSKSEPGRVLLATSPAPASCRAVAGPHRHAAPRFERSCRSPAPPEPPRLPPGKPASLSAGRRTPGPQLPAGERAAGSGGACDLPPGGREQRRAGPRGPPAGCRLAGRTEGLYLNSGLDQIQAQRQSLAHEHVGVVALIERLLQLLQLPAGEVGAGAPPLAARALLVRVPRVCGHAQDAARLSPRPGRRAAATRFCPGGAAERTGLPRALSRWRAASEAAPERRPRCQSHGRPRATPSPDGVPCPLPPPPRPQRLPDSLKGWLSPPTPQAAGSSGVGLTTEAAAAAHEPLSRPSMENGTEAAAAAAAADCSWWPASSYTWWWPSG